MKVGSAIRITGAMLRKVGLLPAATIAVVIAGTAFFVAARGGAGAARAPGFTLTDQRGRPTSLAQFRGRVVLLTFLDPECTQICPLTSQSMVDALRLLGPRAAARVELLAVNVNLSRSTVADVAAYTREHGMPSDWRFLTGAAAALRRVWHAYHIYVAVSPGGDIEHTAVVYVIGPRGTERFESSAGMSYAGVADQAAQLAQLIARVLPGGPGPGVILAGPPPRARFNPARGVRLPPLGPARPAVALGAGHPRLMLFFAGWLGQQFNLPRRLAALDAYAAAARRTGWPPPVAIDEITTEPSPAAARRVLDPLAAALHTPLLEDAGGRLADAYGVGDLPEFVLTAPSGKPVWSHAGWLSAPALRRAVQTALAPPGAGD